MQDSLTEAEDRADTAETELDRAEQGAAEVQASYDRVRDNIPGARGPPGVLRAATTSFRKGTDE